MPLRVYSICHCGVLGAYTGFLFRCLPRIASARPRSQAGTAGVDRQEPSVASREIVEDGPDREEGSDDKTGPTPSTTNPTGARLQFYLKIEKSPKMPGHLLDKWRS